MKKGRPPKEEIITVIIYRKPTGKKYRMLTTEKSIDKIINSRLKHSLLPDNYEIIEIGIGKTFIEIYKKQYNIK
tara:strand:- start:459 stop:680 length:222 start_codon:yes stop_codon:yes gene_type:complete